MKYCKTCKKPETQCQCHEDDQDFVEEAIAIGLGISLMEDLFGNDSSSDNSSDSSGSDFGGFGGGDSGGGGAGSDY